jgi:hypothetical protein
VRLLDEGVVTRLAAESLGTYRSDELDVCITIAMQDGALVWRQPFGTERKLRPVFPGGLSPPPCAAQPPWSSHATQPGA